MDTSIEYVIYDPHDDTVMGKGDFGWIEAKTGLQTCKRWLVADNAKRNCYLDRFQVLAVRVTRIVEVQLVSEQ